MCSGVTEVKSVIQLRVRTRSSCLPALWVTGVLSSVRSKGETRSRWPAFFGGGCWSPQGLSGGFHHPGGHWGACPAPPQSRLAVLVGFTASVDHHARCCNSLLRGRVIFVQQTAGVAGEGEALTEAYPSWQMIWPLTDDCTIYLKSHKQRKSCV